MVGNKETKCVVYTIEDKRKKEKTVVRLFGEVLCFM